MMLRRIVLVLLALPYGVAGFAGEPTEKPPQRQVPVVVAARPAKPAYRRGEPILMDVNVNNGLPGEIRVSGFAFAPNEWSGEASTCGPVDVYRDGVMLNVLRGQPDVRPPRTVSGMGGRAIAPGKSITIQVALDKWRIDDGWKPGTYDVTMLVKTVHLDDYTTARIVADPVRVRIE